MLAASSSMLPTHTSAWSFLSNSSLAIHPPCRLPSFGRRGASITSFVSAGSASPGVIFESGRSPASAVDAATKIAHQVSALRSHNRIGSRRQNSGFMGRPPMLPARPRYHSFPEVSWSVSGHSRRGPQRVMDANEKVVSQFDCGDRFVDPVRTKNGIRAANATVPIESLFFRFPILQVGIN